MYFPKYCLVDLQLSEWNNYSVYIWNRQKAYSCKAQPYCGWHVAKHYKMRFLYYNNDNNNNNCITIIQCTSSISLTCIYKPLLRSCKFNCHTHVAQRTTACSLFTWLTNCLLCLLCKLISCSRNELCCLEKNMKFSNTRCVLSHLITIFDP